MDNIEEKLSSHCVIAAVRDVEKLQEAIDSKVEVIFLMTGNILNISKCVQEVKKSKKSVFVHTDLVKGLTKDAIGIDFLVEHAKPDGIVTTKNNLVGIAKKNGISVIKQVFLVDTMAFKNSIEQLSKTQPDAIELMPALMPRVINDLKNSTSLPIVSAGLIKTETEIKDSLNAGSVAVAVGDDKLWNIDID